MRHSHWVGFGLGLGLAVVSGCSGQVLREPSNSGGSTGIQLTGGIANGVSGGAKNTGGLANASSGGVASGSGGFRASGGSGQGLGGAHGAGGNSSSGGTNASGGTGGAPAGNNSGGGPALNFNPCPPQGQPCVLVPYGDSITDGYSATDAGGYRSKLFHLAIMNGKSITFAGSGDGGPATVDGQPFPAAHEGHSGQGIGDLLTISQTYLSSLNPNIILLMIGTNDLGGDNLDAQLGGLLDATFKAVPTALVVVAQITAQRGDNTGVTQYNALIPAVVQARASTGKHVVMVDMYSAFTSNANYETEYLVDYAHPTDAGYAVMANVWYQAIGSLLR